jgi:hypothetical protein
MQKVNIYTSGSKGKRRDVEGVSELRKGEDGIHAEAGRCAVACQNQGHMQRTFLLGALKCGKSCAR